MRKLLMAFLFCSTSTIANAQIGPEFSTLQKPVICGPMETILKGLADPDIAEKPIWIGQDDTGRSEYMLFVNPKTNAFTLVQVGKTIGCILGIGYKSSLVSDPGTKL